MSVATLGSTMVASPKVDLRPIDVAVADAAVSIPRDALGDPWDRFILATARALELPLVTRDGRIQKTELVETVW
ncbi:MAG: PIN domain-containing protein [Acidimicrobiia bacterium]|nr:PIN domain-containing protein [Acidimicrobiia bacterium]